MCVRVQERLCLSACLCRPLTGSCVFMCTHMQVRHNSSSSWSSPGPSFRGKALLQGALLPCWLGVKLMIGCFTRTCWALTGNRHNHSACRQRKAERFGCLEIQDQSQRDPGLMVQVYSYNPLILLRPRQESVRLEPLLH